MSGAQRYNHDACASAGPAALDIEQCAELSPSCALRVVHRSGEWEQARLANVVIGVALQLQRDAGAQPRAQALPGVPGQLDVDRVLWQAPAAKALGHLRAQPRTALRMAVIGSDLSWEGRQVPAQARRSTRWSVSSNVPSDGRPATSCRYSELG